MPTLLSHLDELEAESIHIFREVAAEFEKPVLLFSGGKDSIVMARLAEKAFWPARIPFPLMHVDTGHNFQEVLDYRDRRVEELGVSLVVASVQESIDQGRVVEETGPRASRNRLQTTTLLDAITSNVQAATTNVSALTALLAATLGGPVVKVAAFSYGVRSALADRPGERSRRKERCQA